MEFAYWNQRRGSILFVLVVFDICCDKMSPNMCVKLSCWKYRTNCQWIECVSVCKVFGIRTCHKLPLAVLCYFDKNELNRPLTICFFGYWTCEDDLLDELRDMIDYSYQNYQVYRQYNRIYLIWKWFFIWVLTQNMNFILFFNTKIKSIHSSD